MKEFFARGLVVVAGVVSLPGAISHLPTRVPAPDYRNDPNPNSQNANDPRLGALRRFFGKFHCPALAYAPEFVAAADAYSLDWRLLPSIAYVESTCGKAAHNNNYFGWDSGRADFPSPVAAIHAVGRRLARSAIYRAKSLDELLARYNPKPEYGRKVKSVMRRIAASE